MPKQITDSTLVQIYTPPRIDVQPESQQSRHFPGQIHSPHALAAVHDRRPRIVKSFLCEVDRVSRQPSAVSIVDCSGDDDDDDEGTPAEVE